MSLAGPEIETDAGHGIVPSPRGTGRELAFQPSSGGVVAGSIDTSNEEKRFRHDRLNDSAQSESHKGLRQRI
jgi:hypothetical protein